MDVGSLKSPAPLIAANSRAPVATAQQQVSLSGTDLSREERPVEEAGSTKGAQGEQQAASTEEVAGAVSVIREFVQSVKRNLDFRLDDSSGRVVVSVTDSESGDVVRQIPSEDALKLAESLEEVRSLLFRAEA